MSLFGDIANAETSKGGNYVLPGLYLLEVSELKIFKSRKGDDLFIAEFNTVESTNDERPIGGSQSWMANLSQHDAAPGNVKAFLAALNNVDESEITAEAAEFAVSEDNPLAGMTVKCEATQIITKAGNPFTKCMWSAAG